MLINQKKERKNKMAVSKVEFVKMLAEKVEASRKDALLFVDALFETAKELTESEGEVKVSPWLKFVMVTRKAHKARNPKTGESIKVPEKTVLKIRMLKGLKAPGEVKRGKPGPKKAGEKPVKKEVKEEKPVKKAAKVAKKPEKEAKKAAPKKGKKGKK
jgi:DNA-binding protein HU-beta